MSALILTLKLDLQSFDALNNLRQQYFPPARNFLSAHVTLFHALPGEQETLIKQTLQEVCATNGILPVAFPKLRFLGKGVAVEVECPEIVQLRKKLATTWSDWLTAQDRQNIKPHVTIQNKVAPDEARQLFDRLAPAWRMADGRGEGLQLWQYLNGPWKLVEEFSFVA